MESFFIRGTLVHTPVRGEVEIIEHALVEVNGNGQIEGTFSRKNDLYDEKLAYARDSGPLVELTKGQYLLPGLVDLHIHAPQWPQAGKALHLPLYDWLENYTYPLEAKFSDIKFAEKAYTSLVDTLIANGTTTALYFASIHLEASKLLANICLDKGQRGLVGKVAMDNPDQCPEFYRDESTEKGLNKTRELIEYIRGMPGNNNGLVKPVVTPRFIPSCTDEMLTGLGEIAKEYDCHVQTHCSQSDKHDAYVIERHGMHDTQSLHRFGLLTDKTVVAHANFVNEDNMNVIKLAQTGIAHCPMSNFYYSNAVFPARRALDKGLKVGLGSDISAGISPSLLQSCAVAVTASRALEEGVDPTENAEKRGTPGARIDFLEAFWMATVGGGLSLNLNVGLLKEGYAFDAMLVDVNSKDSNLLFWDGLDTHEDMLQKIIYGADRHNISKVWVQGRLVKDC